jgi:hypothetical protein
MSLTKIHVFNQVDTALITPNDENSQFPVLNLKDYRRSKVFRSLTNHSEIIFDFGEAVDINSFMVVSNPKLGFGFSQIKIELNVANGWATPLVSQIVVTDDQFQVGSFEFDQTYNVRYARIVLDNASQSFCELANIFIGMYQDLGVIDFDYPLEYKNRTNVEVSRNRYNQKFMDKINKQKFIGGSLKNLTKEEMESVFEIIDYADTVKPVWLRIDSDNIAVNPNRLNGCFFLQSSPSPKFNVGNFWSVDLDFEEAT